MKKHSVSFLVILAVLLLVCPVYAELSPNFDGQMIRVEWLYPDKNTVYYGANASVGSGWEFEDFATTNPQEPTWLDIDINSKEIVIFFTLSNGTKDFWSANFNGFSFSDYNGNIDDITEVRINKDTKFPSLDISKITFDADHIWINLSSLQMNDLSDTIILDVGFKSDPIPEPTTLLLLGLGLVGVAGIRRKLRN